MENPGQPDPNQKKGLPGIIDIVSSQRVSGGSESLNGDVWSVVNTYKEGLHNVQQKETTFKNLET